MSDYPRLIGICGNPKSGKSEVQRLLQEHLDYLPVDDGLPMRAFCTQHLGMSWNDVNTQEGKAGFVEILGKRWQRRDILGTLGNHLEEMFGKDIFAYIATCALDPKLRYSFGSVRRDQGAFYRQQGGVIIGVRNPLAPPSPFEFDRFDESQVDIWIDNNGLAEGMPAEDARMDLGIRVLTALSAWRARQDQAWRLAAA